MQAENLIAHKDDIFSRPKRTWFVTEKEKKLAAKAAKVVYLSNLLVKFFSFVHVVLKYDSIRCVNSVFQLSTIKQLDAIVFTQKNNWMQLYCEIDQLITWGDGIIEIAKLIYFCMNKLDAFVHIDKFRVVLDKISLERSKIVSQIALILKVHHSVLFVFNWILTSRSTFLEASKACSDASLDGH